jgi:hypothetical protein
MVELHPWAELVVVQEEADCNSIVDFADSAAQTPSSSPADWCAQRRRKEGVGLVAGIDSVAGAAC